MRLNGRVRDGNGCDPLGNGTKTLKRLCVFVQREDPILTVGVELDRLVPLRLTCYHAYTYGLSTCSSRRGLK